MRWEPLAAVERGTVVGDVRVSRDVESPQLGNRRDLYAYLPPSHGDGRRYSVLYMHDGLNLFDEATSNGGEWRVDETLERLAGEGIEVIVIGVPHGPDRRHEYAGDGAEAYLSFLVDTVKPLVEESFDVAARRESRGIAGSSLGGVVSLHGLFAHPDVFGLAGVLSPAFWWNGDRLFELVERTPAPPARIYIDVGDEEDSDEKTRAAYVDGFERMTALLRRKGYTDESLRAVLDRGGTHHESVWARRFPEVLRFLLRRRKVGVLSKAV
jgi:predicted alpha/beta superfamily hydrolase